MGECEERTGGECEERTVGECTYGGGRMNQGREESENQVKKRSR